MAWLSGAIQVFPYINIRMHSKLFHQEDSGLQWFTCAEKMCGLPKAKFHSSDFASGYMCSVLRHEMVYIYVCIFAYVPISTCNLADRQNQKKPKKTSDLIHVENLKRILHTAKWQNFLSSLCSEWRKKQDCVHPCEHMKQRNERTLKGWIHLNWVLLKKKTVTQ